MPKPKPFRAHLGEYEGSPIVGSSIKLTGGGTGLNDSLTVDARRFKRNELVAVLVRGRIKNVGYSDASRDLPEYCIEVGTLDVVEGMVIELPIAEEMLRANGERVAKARANADGQPSLEDALDDED